MFSKDRILRDSLNRPIGRVVLYGEYVEGRDIDVTVLIFPMGSKESVKETVFYVDGHKYKLDPSTPEIRFSTMPDKVYVNSTKLLLLNQ